MPWSSHTAQRGEQGVMPWSASSRRGVFALPVGGVLAEPGGLDDAFGEIFGQLADVAGRFFGAAEYALDVHLRPETNHVRGLGQLFACLIEGGQP
jgi:hypothetical protein